MVISPVCEKTWVYKYFFHNVWNENKEKLYHESSIILHVDFLES